MKKVFVTDGVHPLLIEGLEALGFQCDYQPKISLENVRAKIHEYEGIIINSKILMDRAMFDAGKDLKFVGRLGSGLEIIDLEYAAQRNVAIHRAPEGNCNAVAEHALGMLLALANNFLQADAEVREKNWQREKNRGFEVMGKTIGIIGFGYTGMSFARKLEGMGMRVLAYDKYKKHYTKDFRYVEEADLAQIKKEADIISLHLPYTSETYHYIKSNFIDECKDEVIFINTSRGSVIHTEDLVVHLENGKIGGACLDVFENEKPQTFSKKEDQLYQRLYACRNVILSPHVAGWTHESKKRLAEVLLVKITKNLKARNLTYKTN